MAKFRFTKKAVNDLTEIWDYTKKSLSENKLKNIIN